MTRIRPRIAVIAAAVVVALVGLSAWAAISLVFPSSQSVEASAETSPQPAVASVSSAEQAAAAAFAVTGMTAFARTDTAARTLWWARLSPMLSDDAKLDFAHTDPSKVPFTAVTGAASVVEASAHQVLVSVPTAQTSAADATETSAR